MADTTIPVGERGGTITTDAPEVVAELQRQAPPTPAPSVPGSIDLLPAIYGPQGSVARGADLIRQRGEAVAPKLDAAEDALKIPTPQAPRAPRLDAPPARGYSAFLMPVDGESPMASLNKLVAALGVFGAGLGVRGSAHGAAKASAAALSGAMAGWAVGDKERGDRAFKDWRAKSDTLLDQWALEREEYAQAWTAKGKTLEERLTAAKLAAAKYDNTIMANALETQGLEGALKGQMHIEDMAQKYTEAMAKIIASREEKEKDRELRRDIAEQNADLRREMASQKREAEKEKRAELDALWTGQTLRQAAIDYATNGRLPAGLNRSGTGSHIIPKLIADSIEWAKENGIDPNTFPSLRADIKSSGDALKKLRATNVIQEGSIKRLDGHLDKLIELSAKVPRGQRPIANEYILKGRKDWQGDVDTANYILQGTEVGMELAKAFVGTAQGDAATREEGRKVFAAGSTHEQVVGAVQTLRDNVHRNLEINKQNEQDAKSVIDAAMKGGKSSAKITIRRLSDGQVFEGSGAVPPGYELVKK